MEHSDSIIEQQNDTQHTVESTDNSQVKGSVDNENDKSLGNIPEEVSNSHEKDIQNTVESYQSEGNGGDSSTQLDSQEHVQLSEFDETVDYNSDDGSSSGSSPSDPKNSGAVDSKSVKNSSDDDSSTGSSGHESDNIEPVNKQQKPDLSLRPPLITRNSPNTPKPKPKSYVPRWKPQRVQPSRAKKNTVTYIRYGSESESKHTDNESKDEDFIPEGQEG